MKLHFINAEALMQGILELAPEFNIEICDKDDASVIVTVTEEIEDCVEVNLDNGVASISYGGQKIRFFRGLGLLCEALAKGEKKLSKKENPNFRTNGPMFDMARNMVMKPDILKTIFRKQAIMGLNFFIIYLEDLFEVPEYPYFGHMRGRYSKEELRDLDKYAQLFGIELVPSIQCLGHLSRGIQWEAMANLRDTHDTLMVGRDAVYTFIDRMMASIADCFTTKRLDIGMDEAHNMGHGRYKETNEPRPQFELFCEHLEKVIEIADRYNFKTIISSDMIFYMVTQRHYSSKAVFDEAKLSLVPKNVQLMYWKYCIFEPEEFKAVLNMHYKFGNDVIYAGGIQTWLGPVPLYDVTIKSAKVALETCISTKVDEVVATVWGDGRDGTLIFALYGLMLYAEMDYNGFYDEKTIKERFKFICGADADDIIDLERMNFPCGRVNYDKPVREDYVKTSKYLIYNDPMIGLMDKNIEGIDTRTFYANLYEEFKNRGTDEGLFAPAFKYIKAMLWVLILKADYGIRLKKAYETKDMKAIDELYQDAIELENRYDAFRKAAREFYLYYNKSFGFEVLDMRLGTMAKRFETVRYHLDKFKADTNYRIEELEQERKYLIAPGDDDRVTLMEYDFGRFFSASKVFDAFDDFYIG